MYAAKRPSDLQLASASSIASASGGRHALCTNASTTDGNGSKASSDANRRGDGEVVAIHREAEKPYEVRFANGEKHCYSLR